MSRSVTILGSTGSVGTATLDVIRAEAEKFQIHTLTAQTNVTLLAQQAKEFGAKRAVIGDDSLYSDLKNALSGTDIDCAAGRAAVIEAAGTKVDYTMAAIVGMAGLEPILAAIANGGYVAIANKEPLVSAGRLVMDAARKSGATLLPVDSEHNAIFQVFEQANRAFVRRIILTASGGPFRDSTQAQMQAATPEQALAHPNWVMGRKISIDSATMMNKALEVIEAHFLFDMPPDQIDVLIHPQSVIHSMVEYQDGSVLAQMGAPDMRVPIAHTLGWPARIGGAAQRLDFTKISTLSFMPVDACRFPAINYAYDCLRDGQAACIAFNAANELCVSAFLDGKIGLTDIFDIIRRVVEDKKDVSDPVNLGDILALDQMVRDAAEQCILTYNPSTRKVS